MSPTWPSPRRLPQRHAPPYSRRGGITIPEGYSCHVGTLVDHSGTRDVAAYGPMRRAVRNGSPPRTRARKVAFTAFGTRSARRSNFEGIPIDESTRYASCSCCLLSQASTNSTGLAPVIWCAGKGPRRRYRRSRPRLGWCGYRRCPRPRGSWRGTRTCHRELQWSCKE